MYKIYQAETVDEAIKKGLDELKVSESDIKIDVEERGSKGFLGIGKKEAAVKLTIISPELKLYDSIESLMAREDKDTQVPAEDLDKDKTTHDTVEETEEIKAASAESEPVVEGIEKLPDEKTESIQEDTSMEEEISIEDAAASTAEYIQHIITAMNIDNTVSFNISQHQVDIELESQLAAKLIGKRGQTLNALQEIAQIYFNGVYKSYGYVMLDIQNYRAKRQETLENLAYNMSKKALRISEPVKMEPMPSFERKIMHHVLSDLENIETYSEGREPNRYIVIEKK
jgi:spoIIIJ-associated protein